MTAPLGFDRGAPVYNQAPLTPNPSLDLATGQRQSLLFAGQHLIGTIYQHLHIPAFDPASVTSGFTWLPVTTNDFVQTSQGLHEDTTTTVLNPYIAHYGKPTRGIDCTDFAAYIYNMALGVQMHSGTSNQITFPDANPGSLSGAAHADVLDSEGNSLTPDFFYSPNFGDSGTNAPGSLDGVISLLLPRVQILPFTSDTGFYQNFSVAMQVVPVPEPSSIWLLLLAAGVLCMILPRTRNRKKITGR
ncbi:MAG: PEP-CTERM sorting domain-containing protein [Terrimicrobiaceae bacterium]